MEVKVQIQSLQRAVPQFYGAALDFSTPTGFKNLYLHKVLKKVWACDGSTADIRNREPPKQTESHRNIMVSGGRAHPDDILVTAHVIWPFFSLSESWTSPSPSLHEDLLMWVQNPEWDCETRGFFQREAFMPERCGPQCCWRCLKSLNHYFQALIFLFCLLVISVCSSLSLPWFSVQQTGVIHHQSSVPGLVQTPEWRLIKTIVKL